MRLGMWRFAPTPARRDPNAPRPPILLLLGYLTLFGMVILLIEEGQASLFYRQKPSRGLYSLLLRSWRC